VICSAKQLIFIFMVDLYSVAEDFSYQKLKAKRVLTQSLNLSQML